MPLYDCGEEDCDECQKAFGPDRSKTIALRKKRVEYYDAVELARDEHKAPPCRLCLGPVAIFDPENLFTAICPECCPTAIHSDGETGHVFEYDRSEHDNVCQKCGTTEHDDDGGISDRARI